jgi:hypothetical protein
MSVEKISEDTLRGQPFIGVNTNYVSDSNLPRRCDLCFYRAGSNNPNNDCQVEMSLGKKSPKDLFGYSRDEVLPTTLDDKEIAQYCRNFLPFDAE